MNDQQDTSIETASDAVAPADTNRNFVTVTLDDPITIGETVIDKVTLRKPKAGELRGLTLDDLITSDIDTLLKLMPRISKNGSTSWRERVGENVENSGGSVQ